MLSALFALIAGVVTVAAPCTLPVLPILLGAAFVQRARTRPLFIAAGFVAAFALVTVVFSLAARVAGLTPETLRNLGVALLLGFGLLMLLPGLYARLSSAVAARFGSAAGAPQRYDGALGGLTLGATLGLVWTPCAGPVLGSILTLLVTQRDTAWAALLLTLYAAGAALPMMAIAYGGRAAATRLRTVAPFAHRLQQGFGVLVVGFAAAMYFQLDTELTAWLTQFYPSGRIGL